MTESRSEAPSRPDAAAVAERFAGAVGATAWSADHATPKITVPPGRWVEVHEMLKPDLPFFSWLAAVDWTADVAVGDPPESGDVDERYEVMSCLADTGEGKFLIVSTSFPKESPSLGTLTGVYGGADWHEREAAEMFGIDFPGHPNLIKLYLPDGFIGHPLRKSFALMSREVKPWPGSVDVEDMPSTENIEGDGGEA